MMMWLTAVIVAGGSGGGGGSLFALPADAGPDTDPPQPASNRHTRRIAPGRHGLDIPCSPKSARPLIAGLRTEGSEPAQVKSFCLRPAWTRKKLKRTRVTFQVPAALNSASGDSLITRLKSNSGLC